MNEEILQKFTVDAGAAQCAVLALRHLPKLQAGWMYRRKFQDSLNTDMLKRN